VAIPSVVGQSVADAVAEITRSGLIAQVVEVNSDREEGTVTAQSPSAGTVVVEGTQVRVNVSKGPRPVNVPNVVGLPYDQAASELQRAGFVVSRIDEDSDQAAGIVTRQTPSGGSEGSRGSTVTVSVSKGPSTSAVPDVTTQDIAIAQTTLQAAGFRFRIVYEDTDDFTLDGIVNAQDPVGGSQAEPNTIITLFVGRFVEPTTTETTTETTPIP
jgi:serine/threonine-protein kinase